MGGGEFAVVVRLRHPRIIELAKRCVAEPRILLTALNGVSGCLWFSGCLLLRQIHQALRHAVDAARAHGEHHIAVLQHVVQ